MKKLIAAVAFAAVSVSAFAATAFFTGQSHMVSTVTGKMAYECVYSYAGQRFTMLFEHYCPATVEVN